MDQNKIRYEAPLTYDYFQRNTKSTQFNDLSIIQMITFVFFFTSYLEMFKTQNFFFTHPPLQLNCTCYMSVNPLAPVYHYYYIYARRRYRALQFTTLLVFPTNRVFFFPVIKKVSCLTCKLCRTSI